MSYLNDNSPLSPAAAAEITRAWLADWLDPEERFAEDQMRWLMLDLASQAYSETIRHSECVDDYETRLELARGVVTSVWDIITPDEVKGWWRPEEPTPEQAKEQRAARRILWKRHSPLTAYREGYESPSAVVFSSDELIHEVTDYISISWMRHPFLDWVIIDALVTRELQVFGEEVKRLHLPGRRDTTGSHHLYFPTKGNLRKMTGWAPIGSASALAQYVLFVLALPIGAITALYLAGWSMAASWALVIYAACMATHLLFVGMRALRGLWRTSGGKTKPQPKAAELWVDMYQVWRALGGPVVNPTLVREEMARTAAKGAVWDNLIWAILDSRIAGDPAVWVVATTGENG